MPSKKRGEGAGVRGARATRRQEPALPAQEILVKTDVQPHSEVYSKRIFGGNIKVVRGSVLCFLLEMLELSPLPGSQHLGPAKLAPGLPVSLRSQSPLIRTDSHKRKQELFQKES